MKNLIVFLITLTVVSCKNESNSTASLDSEQNIENQSDGLATMTGEFVYFADGAVMEINDKIYGVIINEKMHELDNMADPYKDEPTDYVSVEIRGELIERPANEEGWPYQIDIKEIVSVQKSKADKDDTITIEE